MCFNSPVEAAPKSAHALLVNIDTNTQASAGRADVPEVPARPSVCRSTVKHGAQLILICSYLRRTIRDCDTRESAVRIESALPLNAMQSVHGAKCESDHCCDAVLLPCQFDAPPNREPVGVRDWLLASLLHEAS
jgi:hypothetical protein